ncbi:hypothetical protein [Streptomyces sp. SID3212]|uniref:hypothetical protein n=1 Tax=Streptomyces sp. SID3212 TaxID=2690259 RepID=UPI00136F8C89|nr:hypothetical protein [Streptomyces sp. SID3212]MYV56163.1 hypothetical protein [Streptomyces sp. SID3212]
MTTTQQLRRAGLRTLTAAAACLFLAAAAPAAAQAAPHTAAMRAGGTITCQEVDADLPGVFGRECGSGQWGPLSDFTLTDANSGDSYRCENGWGEGNLWVRGNDCVPAN